MFDVEVSNERDSAATKNASFQRNGLLLHMVGLNDANTDSFLTIPCLQVQVPENNVASTLQSMRRLYSPWESVLSNHMRELPQNSPNSVSDAVIKYVNDLSGHRFQKDSSSQNISK